MELLILTRTTPAIENLLTPLEESIKLKLIPKLTGRVPSNNLFGLRTRVGGLNLINPTAFAETHYHDSVIVTSSLSKAILSQRCEYT